LRDYDYIKIQFLKRDINSGGRGNGI
jgi:hypothetical protein